MEGETASSGREMRRVLEHASRRLARLLEWVADGNANLSDAAPLVEELRDAPLEGKLREARLHVANARDLLRSARGHLDRICADFVGRNPIGMERALQALQPPMHNLRGRHPLAVAWGAHLGQCLVQLASAVDSLSISILFAVRADAGARVNAVTRTETASDLLVAATASAQCLDALRKSMEEFRVLASILVQAVTCADKIAVKRFRQACP